jgi:hypothetical protein
VVLSESKSDLPESMDHREWSKLVRGFLLDSLKHSSEQPCPAIEPINGMEAIQYYVEGEDNGSQMKALITTLEGVQHYHQVLAWSTASKFDRHETMLRDIVNSIEETASSRASSEIR